MIQIIQIGNFVFAMLFTEIVHEVLDFFFSFLWDLEHEMMKTMFCYFICVACIYYWI
jgi:hypothetical protein